MQRIMVHPDLLDEKARMVQQKKQELERMVWELEKSIYMLQSEWSGITGEKFFQDFRLAREVFPTTLGLLSSIQNEFTFIANNFRTTDNTGEVALYIPEELKRDFTVGLLDGSVGETVTGIGDAANALWHDPFGTLASLGYGLTVGRVVDVGRGISFAWDALWGTGTARSDAEKFVEEQKKMITEDKTGYYGGALTGQALAYVFFGRALRSVDNKHGEIGGSSGGKSKSESGKGDVRTGSAEFRPYTDEMRVFITPPKDGFDAFLEREYITIRKSGLDDISTVAKNTGLSEQEIIDMKKHLFLDTHKLSILGSPYKEQYFQADPDIAHVWKKAQNGELTADQKKWFKQLADHEITEKKLMDSGMPLMDESTWNPERDRFDVNPEKNAHDKANETAPNPGALPDYDYSKDFEDNVDRSKDEY
ncbi:WXG100 family type VII secretion target [Paenibacillus sp. JJ-223]|uniref:WXG100 family type VII secretion target n=1 Tax=Paenibacillus sp. JJ-223 TaxID=2905647 RepID=UPI001F287867|nr:WXG100 family type VII secretion target [Paenibacillus sp. JJ-223]CAH1224537.1 hypothetical protein PAECIP111890_05685 [Paenibacillus sp. JJ-223]